MGATKNDFIIKQIQEQNKLQQQIEAHTCSWECTQSGCPTLALQEMLYPYPIEERN